MATAVQFRRGNTQQTSAFTGLIAEVTVDTDKDVVVVHDGVTAGGFPGARESTVIAVSNKTDSAFNKANSANVLAQTGFDQANTAYNQANAAFNKANSANVLAQTAYDQANTGTTISQAGFDKANSANVLAQAAYNQANTGTTIAQAGFDKANSANVIAQAGFDKANSANVLAQAAYDQANTGTTIAQTGFDKANSANVLAQQAYDQANTGTTIAQAGFDKANSANVLAQAGFDKANSANVLAQAGFDKANSANVLAQNAYNFANTLFSANGGTVTGNTSITGNLSAGNVNTTIIYANTVYDSGSRVVSNFTNTAPILITKDSLSNTINISHKTSGVVASGYGNNITIPVFVVDETGHLTQVTNTTIRSATTSQTGVVQLENSVISTNTNTAATPNSVKNAYDHANSAYAQANAANTLADSKFAKVGGIITGNVEIQGNLVISGNVTTVSANNLVIQDNMLYLNEGAANANPDLGLVAAYDDGTYQHTGIFRDATDGYWTIFDHYTPEPDASIYIDTSHASYRVGNFRANIATDVISVRGFDPLDRANSAFDKANAANVLAQQAYDNANTRVLKAGDTMTGTLNVANDTSATSRTTGAVKIAGGLGVVKDIYANNIYASNFVYDNGSRVITVNNQTELITAAGNTTEIQFNTNDKLNASANLKFANNGLWVGNFATSDTVYGGSPLPIDATGIITATKGVMIGDWTAQDEYGRIRYTKGDGVNPLYAFYTDTEGFSNSSVVITNETNTQIQAMVLMDTQAYPWAAVTESTFFGLSGASTSLILTPSTGSEPEFVRLFEVTNRGNVRVGASLIITPTFQTLATRPANNEVGIYFADDTFQHTAAYPLTVKDEGTLLIGNTVQVINFVGDSVVATANANSNTITVTVNALSSNGGSVNGAINISNNALISAHSNTAPVANTTANVDYWSTSSYRAAKYIATLTSGSTYQMIEVNVIHDGTTVYISQFGEVKNSPTSLGLFDGIIAGSTFFLLCTANLNNTTIKLSRTLIPI